MRVSGIFMNQRVFSRRTPGRQVGFIQVHPQMKNHFIANVCVVLRNMLSGAWGRQKNYCNNYIGRSYHVGVSSAKPMHNRCLSC